MPQPHHAQQQQSIFEQQKQQQEDREPEQALVVSVMRQRWYGGSAVLGTVTVPLIKLLQTALSPTREAALSGSTGSAPGAAGHGTANGGNATSGGAGAKERNASPTGDPQSTSAGVGIPTPRHAPAGAQTSSAQASPATETAPVASTFSPAVRDRPLFEAAAGEAVATGPGWMEGWLPLTGAGARETGAAVQLRLHFVPYPA
jgi:hypothetical protein